MAYCLRIYDSGRIIDQSLAGKDSISVGGTGADIVVSGDFSADYFVISKINGKWYARCEDSSVIVNSKEISDGDFFQLNKINKITVSVYEENFDITGSVSIRDNSVTVIGRIDSCDVVLPNPRVSKKHAVITKQNGNYVLSDNNSANHTYLNQAVIEKPEFLSDGDVISIADYNLTFCDGVLSVGNLDDRTQDERHSDYPYWFRPSPRLKKLLPTELVEIDNVPQPTSKPETDIFSRMAMPLVMLISVVLTVALGVMNYTTLIFMVPMSVVSIVLAITSNKKQKKHYVESEKKRVQRYTEYLNRKQDEIQKRILLQEAIMRETYPSALEIIRDIQRSKDNLWECSEKDDDFLHIRIGRGKDNISFEVKGPKDGFVLEEDGLAEKAKDIIKKNKYANDIPILCDIMGSGLLGIVGERSSAKDLLQNIIIQIAYRYSYENVKIIFLYGKDEEKDYSWVKWLPHVYSEDRQQRFMACGLERVTKLLGGFHEILKRRKDGVSDNSVKKTMPLPYYLFVFMRNEYAVGQSVMEYLLDDYVLGAGAVFVCDNITQLPGECQNVIRVGVDKGEIFDKNAANKSKKFSFDRVALDTCERFARTLAPLRIPVDSSGFGLPTAITFLEGYSVEKPDEIDIGRNWENAFAEKSMAVPIGIKGNGKPFMFDINEKKHGPHGLVAGMTGSGKSEMIQSWILSMALRFSPQDVSFILIDFKGTGLITPFVSLEEKTCEDGTVIEPYVLPHLAGTISNLDYKIDRNLIALNMELKRREEIFSKNKVQNIHDYMRKFHMGEIKESLPFLFVIIDEFSEFKVQFPDAMAIVDSLFKIGRTLGVYAILLTQKPAGVVTEQMRANAKFYWCLKVASSMDSKEMILRPLAASISVPGRAYIRVGENDEFELIQSFYSGAPFLPGVMDKGEQNLQATIIEDNGDRVYMNSRKEERVQEKSNTKEIDEVVRYLHNYVERNGLKKADQVWYPKLSDRIYLEDCHCTPEKPGVLAPAVGMVDDPGKQSQYPLLLPFTEQGHIAVYGAPGTGKSTFLRTAVMSMINSYSPEEVNIYIMDFGGWNMGIFRDFPHIGGIANDNEEEKIEKLADYLTRQLNVRKEAFSKEGVGNLLAYNQISSERLPYIVLVLDNFGPVMQLYPNLDVFFLQLSREGGNYGIYLLASANNPIQMGFKVDQNIKYKLSLNMSDKSDYTTIVGRTNGLEPEGNEGRGLVKGKPVLEFQTALPLNPSLYDETIDMSDMGVVEGGIARIIRNQGKKLKDTYKGRKANPIPIMPSVIEYGDINELAIGLSTKDVEPLYLFESGIKSVAIVGTHLSGKSNLVSLLMRIMLNSDRKIVLADLAEEYADTIKEENITRYTNAEEFDQYIEGLAHDLSTRAKILKENPEASYEPITIVIDGYRQAFDLIAEETVTRLDMIVRNGEKVGVNLIVSESNEVMGQLLGMFEKVCSDLIRDGKVVLLGGSLNDYTGIEVESTVSLKNQGVGRYEGYLIDNRVPIRFKAVKV